MDTLLVKDVEKEEILVAEFDIGKLENRENQKKGDYISKVVYVTIS